MKIDVKEGNIMIQEIMIQNVHGFGENSQHISDLSKVNLIYGKNGTGKSTFGRLLKQPELFSTCKIISESDQINVELYNSDYFYENFYQNDQLEGIFTLGRESRELAPQMERLKTQLMDLRKEYKLLAIKKDEAYKRKELLVKWINEKCWKIKKNYDGVFDQALKGAKTKASFQEKLLSIPLSSDIFAEDDLKKRASTIFNTEIGLLTKMQIIDLDSLFELENIDITEHSIVGKDNVLLAEIAEKLGNVDWIHKGAALIATNNYNCPFCQQPLPQDFLVQLREFFDEQFREKTKAFKEWSKQYQVYTEMLISNYNPIKKMEKPIFRDKEYNLLIEKLRANILLNQNNIAIKIENPSYRFNLKKLASTLQEMNKILTEYNKEVEIHNQLINNKEEEKIRLQKNIWQHLRNSNDSELSIELLKQKNLDKDIQRINQELNQCLEAGSQKKTELENLERQLNSILPAVDSINKLLDDAGFTSFRLAKGKELNTYKVVRNNFEDAGSSLSDGEKRYLSFLYFYHRIYDMNVNRIGTEDKVIAFDDPVESLDEDLQRAVSDLINKLIKKMIKGQAPISQVFVMTHNISLYKDLCKNNESATTLHLSKSLGISKFEKNEI